MNIVEATKLLREGQKIRRKVWKASAYLELEPNNPLIVNDYREYFRPAVESLIADDWEVCEGRKLETSKILITGKKDNFCWHCGTKENLTRHHLQLRRERNAQGDLQRGTIPLCKDCHVNVERLRNNAEKIYKKRHKAILINYISKSYLITKKQKDKLIPQLERIWNKKDDALDEKEEKEKDLNT